MSKSDCLTGRELLKYIKGLGGTAARELESIKRHLETCEKCTKELATLKQLIDRLPDRKPGSADDEDHISNETWEAYFRKTLSEPALQAVFSHLACCSECLADFFDIHDAGRTELSEEDKNFIQSVETAAKKDKAELAKAKAQFIVPANPKTKPSYASESAGRRWYQSYRAAPKIALLLLALVLVAVGAYAINYRLKKADRIQTAERAFATLTQKQPIDAFDELRPTGGFEEISLVSRARSRTTSKTPDSLLAKAEMASRAALEMDPENIRLNHYLGTICFFQKRMDQAEDYYSKALRLASSDSQYTALIYNDLALVKVDRQDYQAARQNLLRAIELNPTLPEARYNLAIVAELMQDTDTAVNTWNEYLKLDLDENTGWVKVAESHLKELKE